MILSVGLKYSVRYLICDDTNLYGWSCDVGKVTVYDKIVIEILKKDEIWK